MPILFTRLAAPMFPFWRKAMLVLGLATTLAIFAQRSPQEPVIALQDDRLTLSVQDGGLESILEVLSRLSGVEILSPEGLGSGRVSVDLRNVPFEGGLRRILRGYDTYFLYTGAEKDSPASLTSVWVYPRGRAQLARPTPSETWASTKELEGRLADPDSDVRARAFETLIERRVPGVRETVIRALRGPRERDQEVRTRILRAALDKGVELPLELLSDLVSADPSEQVRLLALRAATDKPALRGIVLAALNDSSPEVRETALEILQQLDAAVRPQP